MQRILFRGFLLSITFLGLVRGPDLWAGPKKPKAANADKCKTIVLSIVEVEQIPIAKTDPSLVIQPAKNIKDQYPHLVALSGKLVGQSSLKKGTAVRRLFTCTAKACGARNQLHNPDTLGEVVCTQCGHPQTADTNYYPYPKDSDGHEMTKFFDLTQIVTKSDEGLEFAKDRTLLHNPGEKAVLATAWTCELCNIPVTEGHKFCPSCNGYHDASDRELSESYQEINRIAEEQKLGTTAHGRAILKTRKMAKAAKEFFGLTKENRDELIRKSKAAQHQAPEFVRKHVKAIAATAGVSLTTAWLMYMYFDTTDYPAELVEKNWTHTVSFESLTMVQEEDWCEDVPSGARDINNLGSRQYSYSQPAPSGIERLVSTSQKTFQKIWHWMSSLTFINVAWAYSGLTDRENGYFTVDDDAPSNRSSSDDGSGWSSPGSTSIPQPPPPPVYKDWCSYRVERWVHSRSERTSGMNPSSSSEMPWPSNQTSFGERVSGQSSSYEWTLRYQDEKGNNKTKAVSRNSIGDFLSREVGFKGTAAVNRFGSVRDFN